MNGTLTWRTVDRLVLLACLILAVWYGVLGYLDQPAERIRGADSIGYYVYLPSILIDGELDLAADFQRLAGKDVFLFPAPNGRAGNPYSIGPALLWSPWFGLGHLITAFSGQTADGYASPYYFFVYWGNTLYVILGLLLTVRLLRTFDLLPGITLLTTLSVLLATQLTYYIFALSATSHGLSFTTVAAFALFLRREGLTWRSGLLGGLTVLVRWQNLLFLPVLAAAVHVSRHGKRPTADQVRGYLPFLGCAALAILPQMIVWQLLYERPFLVPQLPGYVDLTRLPTLKVLFSLQHGLVTWHPLWIAGGVGIWLLSRKDRPWALAIAVVFVLQLYLNGTVRDWWGTWSFGHRRFVNLIPFVAIGVGVLCTSVIEQRRRLTVGTIVALSLWNQAFIFQYQRALIPRSNPPTLTEFFEDKFSLHRTWQSQLSVNTAVHSFRQDDFENFLIYGKQASDIYPDFRNAMKVHSVVAAVEGRWDSAVDDYEGWLAIEPESIAAKWGIADIRLKLGQPDQARELMRELRVSDPEVEKVLQEGKGTLLTRSFFKQYRKELDQIYTE